jgi:lysophospholipase L1-like esterase
MGPEPRGGKDSLDIFTLSKFYRREAKFHSRFCGEGYLRWTFRTPERLYILPPHHEGVYTPTKRGTPGIAGVAHLKVNSLGLRSDEPFPDAQRVIHVFGGSTAIDIWLDQRESWPLVLQDKLNAMSGAPKTWVANVSKWGLSTHHNLMHFADVVPYLPKADVVVILAGLNDMQRAIKSSYPLNVEEIDRQIAYVYLPPRDTSIWSSFGYYRLYQRRREVERKKSIGKTLNGGGDVHLSYFKCRQSQADEDLVRVQPELALELAAYRVRLKKLVDLARARGSRVVLATQPALWKANMTEEERSRLMTGGIAPLGDWIKCQNMRYYAPETLDAMQTRFNDVMRDICVRGMATCVDLERLVAKKAEYYYDDVHYTEAGAETVAEAVAQVIAALR